MKLTLIILFIIVNSTLCFADDLLMEGVTGVKCREAKTADRIFTSFIFKRANRPILSNFDPSQHFAYNNAKWKVFQKPIVYKVPQNGGEICVTFNTQGIYHKKCLAFVNPKTHSVEVEQIINILIYDFQKELENELSRPVSPKDFSVAGIRFRSNPEKGFPCPHNSDLTCFPKDLSIKCGLQQAALPTSLSMLP